MTAHFWIPFFAAALLALLAVDRAEAAQPPNGDRLEQSVAALKAKAAAGRGGYVRIIARLSAAALRQARAATPPPRNAVGAFADASLDAAPAPIRSAQDRLLRRMTTEGGVSSKRIEGVPMIALEVNATALDALVRTGEVSAVFEDKIASPTLNQSGPLIGANVAHNLGAGGAGTTIAILDTGVLAPHQFLAGRVLNGVCFSTNSSWADSQSVCPGGGGSSTAVTAGNPCTFDGCDHGTHVAGIAAGRGSASFAVNGVAPDAKILPVQVFSRIDNESCDPNPRPCPKTFDSDQIAALQFVRQQAGVNNVVAVNMSFGIEDQNTSACDGDVREEFIEKLHGMGIATVISSGNAGHNNAVATPACISAAITVGASDKNDVIAAKSNHSSLVDLLAPGVAIKSSVSPAANGFAVKGETSMAAPHVAGAIAVIRSKAAMSVDQALALLQATGDPVSGSRNNPTRVRLNIGRAITNLIGGPPAAEIDRRRVIRAGAGRCLDVHAPEVAKLGGRVQLWTCNAQPQQLWTAFTGGALRNEAGGLCLDVHAPDLANNGGRIQVWECNTSSQQRWSIVPSNQSIRVSSGLCLDAHAPDQFRDGGRVQIWACNGQLQQRWSFVAPSNIAREAIVRTGAGLCLDVHAPEIATNGGRVQAWACNGQAQQRWTHDATTGAVRVASGLCLDVHAPEMTTNGGRVQIWACNGQPQQQWTPQPDGSLRNGGGLCLDVHAPDQSTNGARVQVWQCNGQQQQRFTSSTF